MTNIPIRDAGRPRAATVLDPPNLVKVCHRYKAETVAERLGLGRVWGLERADTMRRVRELPTYDPATDTAVVCWYVNA